MKGVDYSKGLVLGLVLLSSVFFVIFLLRGSTSSDLEEDKPGSSQITEADQEEATIVEDKTEEIEEDNNQIVAENNNKDAPVEDENNNQTDEDQAETPSQTFKGQYIDYTEEDFENLKDQQRLLYFHADWCSRCQRLEADILDNIADIPDNTVILKIDYDSNQALRQKYQVTTQTTVVSVDENGQSTNKVLLYKRPTLENLINEIG